MKFLCDRCKTRYSIGDERVRGKILKIRCKHCSNVITVREGMQVDDGSVVGPLPSDPSRSKKSTTIAPEALDERNASGLLNVTNLAPTTTQSGVQPRRPAESSLGAALAPSPSGQHPAVAKAVPSPRATASPAFGTAVAPRTNGAAALPARPAAGADLFDDVPEKTQLQAPPLPESPVPSATPLVNTEPAAAPPRTPPDDGFTGDDDLDIGEVSRVVNLADLARQAKPRRAATNAATSRATGAQSSLRATGAQPAFRGTGAQPAFRGTGTSPILPPSPSGPIIAPALEPAGDPSLVPPPAFSPADPSASGAIVSGSPPADGTPPVASSHRRGLVILLGVAAVLVIGVVIAVVVLVSPATESTGGSLGKVNDIDTSRPDDPVSHRPTGPTPTAGSGSATVAAPTGQTLPHVPIRRPNPPPPGHDEPVTPSADSLRSDEIEDVARKHQDMTQRCYMRSQRGADAILVGDVKKIAVTLLIEKDGTVTDVQLSDHAADTLGKCLSTSIRGWKFRSSAGGRFRFSLNFVSS